MEYNPDGWPRRGDPLGVLENIADDADPLAARDLDNGRFAHALGEDGVPLLHYIARQHLRRRRRAKGSLGGVLNFTCLSFRVKASRLSNGFERTDSP